MHITSLVDSIKNKSTMPVVGTWQTVYNPNITEVLCDMGFAFITIDLEHSSIDMNQVAHLIQIITLKGKAALVRLGEKNENTIKRVMDMGADGIIVADVRTPEEANRIVKAVKYPPFGTRGVGLSRAQKYGEGFSEYLEWNKDSSIVVAQIEHVDAIRNLSEILSVEGLDATIIGPYDLSGSMGFPGEFHREDVINELDRYLQTCNEYGHIAGYHVVSSDYRDLLPYIEKGYRFLPFGFDLKFMIDKCKESITQLNEHLKELDDA